MNYERVLSLDQSVRESIKASDPLFFEARVLRILNHLHKGNIEHFRRLREARLALHKRIAECAQDGKILVIESGRDCDCVEYSGRTRIIEASVAAFDKLADEIAEWADGPFHLDIDKPSEDEFIRYESRDLVLEAFEDGHPHHIVSRFG